MMSSADQTGAEITNGATHAGLTRYPSQSAHKHAQMASHAASHSLGPEGSLVVAARSNEHHLGTVGAGRQQLVSP